MSLLAFRDTQVRYGGRTALHGLTLTIGAGEIVALIGESGSGKSTAALAAIGLLPDGASREGSILIDGQDPRDLPERFRGGTIGTVFQEPMRALNPVMTIGAQVAEAVRLHRGIGGRAARAEAAALLVQVGLSPDRAPPGRYPHQLSGGQLQRVCIAVAIAGNPRLLIADEPTTALDVTTQAHVMALLTALVRERGMGMLLVSHDLALVGAVADRIAVLKDGALIEEGPAARVLTNPQAPYTASLIARVRHRPVRTGAAAASATPVLAVEAVTRTHAGLLRRHAAKPALDNVSFHVAPGEIVGVVGESGAGKTTLLRTVLGLDTPQAGRVRIDGVTLHTARGGPLRALRRRVQAVFQDPSGSFDPRQRIGTIVAEPLHLLDEAPAPAERRRRVAAALERVGLKPSDADRFPHEFSGGQRQRIGIARALILEPRLVVLDEAVSALDVSIRADILDLLARLADDLGVAYLFVSHDLSVMRAVTDRLLVIKDGRIVEQGPTDAILDAPEHAYTRALVAATPDLDAVIAARKAD